MNSEIKHLLLSAHIARENHAPALAVETQVDATEPTQAHVAHVVIAVVGALAAIMVGTQPRSRLSRGRRWRARRGDGTRRPPHRVRRAALRGRSQHRGRRCAHRHML